MKYKIETLKVGSDKSIDIPDGYIPIKYDCSIEKREPSVSLVKTITVLVPIEKKDTKVKDIEEKDIEEKCFFCDKNFTRDKIGIRSICAICLGQLYGIARDSHKSPEC